MAFDAGMLAASLSEIRRTACGARIEKIYQPERDELIIQMRSFEGGKKLLVNAGSNNPRLCFSESKKENPQNPPMFCMLLRKYLQGAKIVEIDQADFDRVAILGFETRDELGFECKRYLVCELMGKYSNIFFTDGDKKIITALKLGELSFDSVRQIVPGMIYSLPSACGKISPLSVSVESFRELYSSAPAERPFDKFIVSTFMGISSAVAREVCFRATGHTDTPIRYCFPEDAEREFFALVDHIRNESFEPCLVLDGERPAEYSFIPLTQYAGLELRPFDSAGRLLDTYFESRDNAERVRQRAADILKLLTNTESRIRKKLELQRAELQECERGSDYKKYGDLITANIYRLSRGEARAVFDDYEDMREDGSFGRIEVEMDTRLSPAANAQRYYKKYNKTKTAKLELSRQIELGEGELQYVYSVFEALTRAETPADLLEIRDELYRSGYASRMKSYTAHKNHAPTVMVFETPDGMRVLCGKNNTQNEYITHKLAEKHDYWFHAKNTAGSHTLLVTEGKEPTDLDFTTAAEIAAFYSRAEGDNVAVDYTLAKNVKRVAGAKPGFVIYHTNWTAYVTPHADKIGALRKK